MPWRVSDILHKATPGQELVIKVPSSIALRVRVCVCALRACVRVNKRRVCAILECWQGWVRTVRQQKQHAFVELSDGSHQTPLQIVATPELVKGFVQNSLI
jgi:hypothetical protein